MQEANLKQLSILCSKYMTFWKEQNHEVSKGTIGCQGLQGRELRIFRADKVFHMIL